MTQCTIHGLAIPFREAFTHSTKQRAVSDSILVRIGTDDGRFAWGEGLARPYVTGETVDTVRRHIRDVIWPALSGVSLDGPGPGELLAYVAEVLPPSCPSAQEAANGVVAHHAARCAVELALVGCLAAAAGQSLSACLPPRTDRLCYSGVVGSSDPASCVRLAEKMVALGLSDFKVKVGDENSVARVAAVREVVGPKALIRVDANGVWTLPRAISEIAELTPYGIDSCEEPLGRVRCDEIPELLENVSVPILLDESLVTAEDARRFAEVGGELQFNLRVSKCGGLGPCLDVARIAGRAGLDYVVGCQVGETSLLSAAGRHLAAHLADHRHLEGSFGELLLAEDIASPSVQFGRGGEAPLLTGAGLGVEVLPDRIERFAVFEDVLA